MTSAISLATQINAIRFRLEVNLATINSNSSVARSAASAVANAFGAIAADIDHLSEIEKALMKIGEERILAAAK